MSQRQSGYARKPRDEYYTPSWVTEALLPHLEPGCPIWEPACGTGKMVKALVRGGHPVVASDISEGVDFLTTTLPGWQAIVTNPPFGLAQDFIERALELTRPHDGAVFLLLRTDFDHAKTRQHLFGKSETFAKKIVLTRRIKWFEDSKGHPSFNHAWFGWDWKRHGQPTLAYHHEE